MNKIYFDSCILVAFFSTHKEEEQKKKEIYRVFRIFEKLQDVEFFISSWTIAEMMNVMLCRHKLKNEFVLECESLLQNKRRLGQLKINIVDPQGNSDNYDFQEFIYDIRENILKYHSGVGDIIHSVIMKNNKIESILTFDDKDDYKQIQGLTVLHPKDIQVVENE